MEISTFQGPAAGEERLRQPRVVVHRLTDLHQGPSPFSSPEPKLEDYFVRNLEHSKPGTRTVTASESGSGFTLTLSRGRCGIISGRLTCGSGVTASSFTLVSRDFYHLFRTTQLFVPSDDLGEQPAHGLRGIDCVYSRQHPWRVDPSCSLYRFSTSRRCHTRICFRV